MDSKIGNNPNLLFFDDENGIARSIASK